MPTRFNIRTGVAKVESFLELPVLAMIPCVRRITPADGAGLSAAQQNISVITQRHSPCGEAFRSLETALLPSDAEPALKFLLFTSAKPSEGKTTTVSNLACILAEGGRKILLIDADLRRPKIHHRFGLNREVGLSTILTGRTTFEESIRTIPEIPNLDVLPCGPIPAFPVAMLSSNTMANLLTKCAGIYTHVLIDSPPILSVADGVILARATDAIVLVVRRGKSSKRVVRRTHNLLLRSGVRVAGIVLNAVNPSYRERFGFNILLERWRRFGDRVRGRPMAPGKRKIEA